MIRPADRRTSRRIVCAAAAVFLRKGRQEVHFPVEQGGFAVTLFFRDGLIQRPAQIVQRPLPLEGNGAGTSGETGKLRFFRFMRTFLKCLSFCYLQIANLDEDT